MKRKIAAILAADVAEYSRLVAEDEEGALGQLVASVEVFKASIAAHDGRIFNTAGDAVLAEFQSAVEAVRSAIEIQERLRERAQVHPPNRRMLFRMGISIGDVVENGSDLLGDGVNVAARLQSLSEPGGLAISRWVQEQIAGKVTAEFRDAGHQLVRNMPAPIHVFRSKMAPIDAAPQVSAQAPQRRPPRISLRRSHLTMLAGSVAAIAVAGSLFVFIPRYPASVTTSEVSPVPARFEEPPPSSAVPSFQQPAAHPETQGNVVPPEQPAAPAPDSGVVAEPAPAPTSAPPAGPAVEPASIDISPPPPFLPAPRNALPKIEAPTVVTVPAAPPVSRGAATTPAVNPAAQEPVSVAPSAPAPVATIEPPRSEVPPGSAATIPQSRPPVVSSPASPPPHFAQQESAADRKRQKVQCAEILERAQLGDLTSDDRDFLRSKCR
jgi:adenylate cyclase